MIYYDIVPKTPDRYARQVSREELQNKAQVLSLHTPQTPETIGMINADFLAKMQQPFWLINTSRGSVVETTTLVEALKQGKVKGAALDVLEYEKSSFENLFEKQDHQALNFLLQAPNVLLSPHVAGWTQESHRKLAQYIVDQILHAFG